jgi:hypothetical protein
MKTEVEPNPNTLCLSNTPQTTNNFQHSLLIMQFILHKNDISINDNVWYRTYLGT